MSCVLYWYIGNDCYLISLNCFVVNKKRIDMIKNLIKQYFKPLLEWYGKYYVHSQQRKYVRDGHKNSRWFRYAFAECGDHLTINGNPLIHDPEKIHVGSYFTINNGAQICPRGGVYIGNYVTMSRGSQITAGMLIQVNG